MSTRINNRTLVSMFWVKRGLALTISAVITLVISGCAAPDSSSAESEAVPLSETEPNIASCPGGGDLVLTNGKILTVDVSDSIVSSVRIRHDKFFSVGDDVGTQICDRVIDLEGRTVVPGLQNNHMHYLRAGMRPGHGISGVETATSIADVQRLVAGRAATLPPADDSLDGTGFITILNAWNPRQFMEERPPTLEELDEAAPNHAVFMMAYIFGPAVTNSIGKRFFEAAGIPVGEDGVLATRPGSFNTPGLQAYARLQEDHTLEDKKRSLRELMRYSNTVGLSTVLEGGGGFPGPGAFDEYSEYEAIMSLWQEDELTVRIRAQIQAWATAETGTAAIQQRVDNTFLGLGDDMFKVYGFGENIVWETTPIQPLELFVEAFTIAAANGWLVHQHSIDVEELEMHTTAFEIVNETYPIADLHWNLSHVQEIDEGILDRLIAMGAGVATQIHYYHGDFRMGDLGPPYRTILDSGINMSAGSDATAFSPWVWLYHMTTGKTSYGDPILAHESVTRMEALRATTMGTAWDALEDDNLGSIEPGKLADIVVLSADYLTVADEELRDIKSTLTLIGGEIVYSDGSLVNCGTDGAWFRDMPDNSCNL
jgi:predicted amidohydrolase YtcJ